MSFNTANKEQLAAWDGPDGTQWTAHEAHYNAALSRYQQRFLDATQIAGDNAVLDVGCGTGLTSREAAQKAPEGSVLGVDLSTRMIELARQRAKEEGVENVAFKQADAQVYPFSSSSFDRVISRTGAMFFADPTGAFTNIASAMRPGGRLTLLTWQSLDGNEWLLGLRGALSLGRDLPVPRMSVPGPFGLADPHFIDEVLTKAGYVDLDIGSIEEPFKFGSDREDAFVFVGSLGFTQSMIEPLDQHQRAQAMDNVREMMSAHDQGDGVWFDSAAWLITATRS